jgi:hypothetical protein
MHTGLGPRPLFMCLACLPTTVAPAPLDAGARSGGVGPSSSNDVGDGTRFRALPGGRGTPVAPADLTPEQAQRLFPPKAPPLQPPPLPVAVSTDRAGPSASSAVAPTRSSARLQEAAATVVDVDGGCVGAGMQEQPRVQGSVASDGGCGAFSTDWQPLPTAVAPSLLSSPAPWPTAEAAGEGEIEEELEVLLQVFAETDKLGLLWTSDGGGMGGGVEATGVAGAAPVVDEDMMAALSPWGDKLN